MISTFLLLEDIRDQLEEAFEGIPYWEPVDGGQGVNADGEATFTEPRIYLHSAPPKRFGQTINGREQGEDVPFMIVRLIRESLSFDDGLYRGNFIVVVLFKIFNPERADLLGNDVHNMKDRIVHTFAKRTLWAEGHFVREYPIQFSMGSDKPEEIYASDWQKFDAFDGGVVMVKFTAAAPEPEDCLDEI